MESYSELALFYDELMNDVDYNKWTEYTLKLAEKSGFSPKNILDTACGTGNISLPMARRGFKVTALDISSDMLTVAENKARQEKLAIKFLNQDMCQMKLKEKYDCVLCMCDGVNYLIRESDLISFFTNVYANIEDTGIFIFDISSSYKLKNILGDNTLFQEKDDINYVWINSFDTEYQTLDMQLIFFIPQESGGKHIYTKFEEYHTQKCYEADYLIEKLKEVGFKNVKAYDSFSFDEPNIFSERIFFAATKE